MPFLCPVCGEKSRLELHCKEVDLYRCPGCDHCFSDYDSIIDHENYGQDYFEERHRNFFKYPDLRLYGEIASYISAFKVNASVIDLGCGKGEFLKFLRKKNTQLSLTGIDLACQPEADGIDFLRGDVLTTPFDEQFDIVICIEVIEHVLDIQRFMSCINKLCKPGGLVIIGTINDRSIIYKIARLLFCFGFKSPCERLYDKHHLNHFNLASLKYFVNKNNYSIIKIIFHNNPIVSVDFPDNNAPKWMIGIFRIFLRVIFFLSILSKRTTFQTIICKHQTN